MNLKDRRRISTITAPLMCGASMVFLAGVATLIVLWVDMPGLAEQALEIEAEALDEMLETAAASSDLSLKAAPNGLALASALPEQPTFTRTFVAIAMGVLWPIFWIEAVFHWFTRPWSKTYRPYHALSLLFCVLPPLRMCARNPELGDAMWIPSLGWRIPNEHLRLKLTRLFSLPMLFIAILILPVLGIEFFLKAKVAESATLRFGLHFSTGLIWFAFTTEFIVMISAAENRLAYCKKHWLDLAIILLPLISFLRSLQIVRATRLAKLTKVQQLTKMARVYRLRGVSTKALRAFLLLELAGKVLRPNPEKEMVRLRAEHRRLSKELRELEARIAELDTKHNVE
jgi:hypothetical protein